MSLRMVPDTRKAGTPRSPRWSVTGRLDPAAAYVAPRLRVGVRQAERRLYSCFEEAALYVEAFHSLGDIARLERHMAPLLKVYQGRTPAPLCAATYRLESEADGREDTDVESFQLEPSEKTRDRALRALDQAILRSVALRDAIAAAPLS